MRSGPNVRAAMLHRLQTIPGQDGQAPIHFHEGGEHASLGVPQGQPIPPAKHAAAAAGKYGRLAEKQEMFRRNVLTGGR